MLSEVLSSVAQECGVDLDDAVRLVRRPGVASLDASAAQEEREDDQRDERGDAERGTEAGFGGGRKTGRRGV